MGRRWILWSLVGLAVLAIAAPAAASTHMSVPVSGGIILAFGATYDSGGRSLTHRGADVCGTPGEDVLAACDGVVTFAGEVPADGGGRTCAVTIRSGDGLLVCVSPLASAGVRAGQSVRTGDAVGVLAGSGDRSSSSAHVHLSARDGGAYIDPAPLLGAAAVDIRADEPIALPGGSTDGGKGTAGSSAVNAGARSGLPVGSSVSAMAVSPVPAGAVAPVVDIVRIRHACAADIGVLRSPGGSPHARLLYEARLVDVIHRPRLALHGATRTLVNGGAFAVLIGLIGALTVHRRSACAAAHLGRSSK